MRDLPERLLNDLNDAASSMGGIRIERLFTNEPDRLDQLTVEAAGIALDLSKNQYVDMPQFVGVYSQCANDTGVVSEEYCQGRVAHAI